MLEGEGREVGPTYNRGDVLEEHGVVPEVRDMEARGRARALPDPGPKVMPWLRPTCRTHVVSANTFKVRPEPAEPTYLDGPAVLKKMGWTGEQLLTAQAKLSFPKPARKRERFVENVGIEITALPWSEATARSGSETFHAS